MGFKIRDKSLFWTESGWRNNYELKVLNSPRPINPSLTLYLSCRYDHHSFLRIVQSYRNFSRTIKQYLYGDKLIQQAMILQLRNQFLIPFTCQTPVQLVRYGAQRRMADQLDRDYQLLSHNYHPSQLYAYELHNKYIRDQNDNTTKLENNEQTLQNIIEKQLKQQIQQQKQKLGLGQKLSLQKFTQIFMRIIKKARNYTNDHHQTRQADGQFNDFLEKRRPFVYPNTNGTGH